MSHPNSPRHLITFTLTVMLLPVAFTSCRPKPADNESPDDEIVHVPEIHQNGLATGKSNLLISQSQSPVHWQLWDSNLFTRAASEKRTVFALIGSGTDPNTLAVLERINQSPSTCALLNAHHVNTLIDSNIHPDKQFFGAMLCTRGRVPVTTPLLVWFSYEGAPISWSPVGTAANRNIEELIVRMSNTVDQVWKEDPNYVLENSREDFSRRMQFVIPEPYKEDPLGLTMRAIRQTASLYDPTSNTIDGLDNLSPARVIELLTKASYHSDASQTQQQRYLRVATLAADHILIRGLMDPLDGGIFDGVQNTTTALPVFAKDLRAQVFSLKAFYALYQATNESRYLDAANAVMAYIETHLALPDGGYLSGIIHTTKQAQDNPCVWTLEEIEAALTEEEILIATQAFGLQGLGNVPLVDDPDRSYFRKNTLTWKVSRNDLARLVSLDPAELTVRLESITKKLAKIRTEKSQHRFTENLNTSGAISLYASACIAGYRATGDPALLKKAIKTLDHIKKNFIDKSGNLHRTRFAGATGLHHGCGSDYALATQAALDIHEVTLEPTWFELAQQLHSSMNASLAKNDKHYITEYSGEHYPRAYQTKLYYTLQPLNNDNTWAIAYANARRITKRKPSESLTAQANNLESILQTNTSKAAVACIDYLLGDSILNTPTVYIKTPASPELLLAASQKNCQIVALDDQSAHPKLGEEAGQLAPGQAIITSRNKIIGTVKTPAELNDMIR